MQQRFREERAQPLLQVLPRVVRHPYRSTRESRLPYTESKGVATPLYELQGVATPLRGVLRES